MKETGVDISAETFFQIMSFFLNAMAFFGVDRWEKLAMSPRGRLVRRTLKWALLSSALGALLWMISDQRFTALQIVLPVSIATIGITVFGEMGRMIRRDSTSAYVVSSLVGGCIAGNLLHAGIMGVFIFGGFGGFAGALICITERQSSRRADALSRQTTSTA
jgi:hypothetical protein